MTFNNIINGFFPEIFLSLCILIQFLYNAYYIVLHQNKGYTFAKNIFYQSFIVLFLTFLLVLHSKNNVKILNNLFIIDNSVHIIKTIFLLVSIISLPLIFNTSLLQKIKVNDIFMLFLLSILAMLLLFGATDMISVYMVLEMQALCFYVFSGSDKRATYSTEISIKYFILSSLASIIFLFGSAMIYLSIGSLNFLTIKALLYEDTFFLDQNFYLIIGVLFIGLAFIFKLGVAPFHFWIIDVYEGSPLYATIIFSILPKFVIFFIFLKFLDIYSLFFSNFFFSLLEFLGLLSAFIGVYFTIYEKKLKRFMVFSSLGQFSSVISMLGDYDLYIVSSLYFFIVNYVIISLIMWYSYFFFAQYQNIVLEFYKKKESISFEYFSYTLYKELFFSHKLFAIILLLGFFSMTGLPGLNGFWGKFFIFNSIVEYDKEVFSFILIVLTNSIAAFYYIRFIKIIFFENKAKNEGIHNSFTLIESELLLIHSYIYSLLFLLLLYIFFLPEPLYILLEYLILSSTFY